MRTHLRPSPIFFLILAVTVVGGVLLVLFPDVQGSHLEPLGTIGLLLMVIGGWALSLTLHEFGHALLAYRGGDTSVADKGYLTMDVRRYTDPVLSLVLPLVLLAIGGIPLPGGAVWINRWALKSRTAATWVSLAGPLSNLILGAVLTVVVAFVPGIPATLIIGLSLLAWLQILAFVLNILPVPGLDGWGAIEAYLSPQAREFGAKARPWAPLILFALLLGFRPLQDLFFTVSRALFSLMGGSSYIAELGFYLFQFWR